jgi:hypothetical protein
MGALITGAVDVRKAPTMKVNHAQIEDRIALR